MTFAAAVIALSCGSEKSTGETPGVRPAITQAGLDALANSLQLKLTLVENLPATCPNDAPFNQCHDARLTLENTGAAFDATGWAIYFTSGHRVLRADTAELGIRHVEGSLHLIEPTAAFTGFATSEAKAIAFQAAFCMFAESDAMPRAYVAAPGLEPAIIANTDSEDVSAWLSPLTTPEQTLCGRGDATVIATAATRFADNAALEDLGAAAIAADIVPRPLSVTLGAGALDLSRGLDLRAPALSAETLAAVSERLAQLGVTATPDAHPVNVSIDPLHAAFEGRAAREAYHLEVAADAISVVGGDGAGALYGLQSLLALVPAEGSLAEGLPLLEVPYDAPRYPYRGLHVDVARSFHGLPQMLRILSQMAAYKLNALHLHLSDDEGFRLEIPGLPELTEIGARRCHTPLAAGAGPAPAQVRCLSPQLGSGPFDDTPGTGHFTRADFVALLRRAAALSIEVIPEFDLPAHAHAAIQAMDARSARGDATYALRDPGDTSEYLSAQSYRDNVVNPCLESPYVFVAKLMDEVLAMYDEAGAVLRTWHTGADEVPAGAWTESPACAALFASGGPVRSASDVQAYFVTRVNALAQERGLGLRAVSEGMLAEPVGASGAPLLLDPASDLGGNEVSIHWWSTLRWFDDSLAQYTDLGYQVVHRTADYLFLDHPSEADPKERGLSWATRFIDTRKLFSYISGNLAANRQLLKECTSPGGCTDTLLGATPVPRPENVIGLEATLWGESIRTDEQLEYMLFPRLLALAERAWHRAAWEPLDGMDAAAVVDRAALDADFARFANTLGHKELPKLEQAGIRYRIEVPGGRLVNGTLEANLSAPGLTIEYRTASGDFAAYDPAEPPSVNATEVRAVTSRGRVGRAVPVRPE